VVEDTRENALENAHPGSGVLEDMRENTLVMDGTREKLPPFVMRVLAHSCRCTVLQRVARGVLGCSLLDDDEPVRTKRGPTPLRRIIGAMFVLAFMFLATDFFTQQARCLLWNKEVDIR
jgi:hypothetical protein